MLKGIHHIAIICSNYEVSKKFYVDYLGFEILRESYRSDRESYKLDLTLNGEYCIELFSFPETPERQSKPEACGLRHLAFMVEDIQLAIQKLTKFNIVCESIRVDENTQKKFTFFNDPDQLPIELYQI
jgi:glyoxylase I family protein